MRKVHRPPIVVSYTSVAVGEYSCGGDAVNSNRPISDNEGSKWNVFVTFTKMDTIQRQANKLFCSLCDTILNYRSRSPYRITGIFYCAPEYTGKAATLTASQVFLSHPIVSWSDGKPPKAQMGLSWLCKSDAI